MTTTLPLDVHLPSAKRLAASQTPFLLVNLACVRENIQRLVAYAAGNAGRLRPHLKTTKMTVIWAEMLHAGLTHFKCATTREAAVFADLMQRTPNVSADLLIAYPHREPALARLAEIARRNLRLSVICEDPRIARDAPASLGVFVDVNPGMNRTGIPIAHADIVLDVARAAGDRFCGVHFYEGHIRGGSPESRRAEAEACYIRLAALIGALRSAGIDIGEVVTSGTPTFLHALRSSTLGSLGCAHRVSPGTVILHDFGYRDMLPEIDFTFAAFVISRIVSRPHADIVTLDAGSKSIAAESGDPCAIVLGRPDMVAMKPSEEHLPFRVEGGRPPELGQILALVPRHICPTVNLADAALVLDGDQDLGWRDVEARGHETTAG